jgi:hypothetical protein
MPPPKSYNKLLQHGRQLKAELAADQPKTSPAGKKQTARPRSPLAAWERQFSVASLSILDP